MKANEKKQIYLDRFPAIISQRMIRHDCTLTNPFFDLNYNLVYHLGRWNDTFEGRKFWNDIYILYYENEIILHQQLLDIFHKHNIDP